MLALHKEDFRKNVLLREIKKLKYALDIKKLC